MSQEVGVDLDKHVLRQGNELHDSC